MTKQEFPEPLRGTYGSRMVKGSAPAPVLTPAVCGMCFPLPAARGQLSDWGGGGSQEIGHTISLADHPNLGLWRTAGHIASVLSLEFGKR